MDIVLFPVNHSSSQHMKVFNTKNTIIKLSFQTVHKELFQVLTRVGVICHCNTIYIVLCSCRIFLRIILYLVIVLSDPSIYGYRIFLWYLQKYLFAFIIFIHFFLLFLFLDKYRYANKYIQCYCCVRFDSRKAIKKIP
jgi:hypothetical protein